jgi:hypothetical protein
VVGPRSPAERAALQHGDIIVGRQLQLTNEKPIRLRIGAAASDRHIVGLYVSLRADAPAIETSRTHS